MNPAEAVAAFQDCGADLALGHHYATFQLTDEGIDEPVKDLAEALGAANVAPERFRASNPANRYALKQRWSNEAGLSKRARYR